MAKLQQLINEICPNGVRYMPLCTVAKISNGKDHKPLSDGDIPVYGSGGIMRGVDTHIYDKPSVLIPRKGSLENIFFVDTPFWTVDTIFYTVIDERVIVPKFFYYVIVSQHVEELNQAGGVPSLTKAVLDKVTVPLPPLPVQQEIVRILDTFTQLEAELEAELETELETRETQYKYYQEQLLVSRKDSRQVRLGEIFSMKAGKSISSASISDSPGDGALYPCYGGNGLRGYVKNSSHKGKAVIIGRQGALCGNVKRVDKEYYATEHAVVVTPKQNINIDWGYYVLAAMNLNQYATKSAQPGLSVKKIEDLWVAVPPLEEQARIVAILDRFDALVNDITQGLPAEIDARRKQYEYYRDKLLTFKEKVS